MANSKTFLLLGLALAVVLVISCEVSARDLAEVAQAQETMQKDSVEETQYGYGHGHGHGYGHGYGHEHGHHHGYGHGHGPGYGHHPPVHGTAETQEESESDQN